MGANNPDLKVWLCVEKLKVCCADGYYGAECKPCSKVGNNGKLCSGRGKCKGSGTRKGNGQCQCDKGFGSAHLLQVHIQSAHKEKSKKCTLCSDMFSTSELLRNHHSHAHDMSKLFHCSICSKTFNSKELLEHHVARAHEMRNCEICPHCSKQFSRLKAHLLICSVKWSDTERRKFECPNCDKTYLDKGALNKHIKKSCKAAD